MTLRPALAMIAGAALVALIGYLAGGAYAARFVEEKEPLARQAVADVGGEPATPRFFNRLGAATRHPVVGNAESLDETTRAKVARAVASIPGIGGVFWEDGTAVAESSEPVFTPLHCQEDVEGLLQTRTIRFEEGSSELTRSSDMLIDEVAEALRPCLGSLIAVTGHTDKSGAEPTNLALSLERAQAVRQALVARGIPSDGVRARGIGSSEPVPGLQPEDPANRRIEFSVLMTEPLLPTPVDTPGPR